MMAGETYLHVTQCLFGYGCDDHESLEALRDDCNHYEERPASPADLLDALGFPSDEAVEAAAEAMVEDATDHTWDQLSPRAHEHWLHNARVALKAGVDAHRTEEET